MKPIFEQAFRFHKEGKLKEAERLYREVLKIEPRHPDTNHNLGVILFSMNKIEDSLQLFKTATEANSSVEQFWLSYSDVLIKQNKLEEAEASFKKAIELNSVHAKTHYNLGIILQKQNKFIEAEKSFKKALELQQDYFEVYSALGSTLLELGKNDEAEKIYRKAIILKPDYAETYNNLGATLQKKKIFNEAEINYKKTIELKPDYVAAYNNLGILYEKIGKLNEAESNFKKAIELKPDYISAYNALGTTLFKLDKIDDAKRIFKKAIDLKPDYFEVYNNLGNILNDEGDLMAAIDNYKQALIIHPDFSATWNNIFYPLQAIKLQTLSLDDHLPSLNEDVSSNYAKSARSILSFNLNLANSFTDSTLNKTLNILSSANNTFIKNPKVPTSKLTKPILPKKITAMKCTGRTGTGLLHSLIDGHPEVSTLPSIYFSEFFDYSTWEKIIEGGWQEMVDRFVTTYDVLFDTLSTVPIASKNEQFIINIARKEGMINLGKEKNEILSVDKKIFIKELKQLMNCYDCLDQFTFFKLVHSAYDKAIADHNKKNLIFYHIHNPDVYAQLNFLRLAPNTNWLIMVREPIQNCESWITKNFNDNSYRNITSKIFQMLFEVNHVIFQNDNSIGVRLEDLKKYPKKTMQALCNWLGIKEEDSLYQMTAQGKKWWGDPTSPDYKKEGMNPFGKVSINRKLGSVFSENDQFILRTLFYPFSVRFGYAEENLKKFKEDLKVIRPMLNEMFDFEKKLVQHTKTSTEKFMKSGPYLYLRSGMIERWNTLNKYHTYHNMLTPLKIN